MKTNFKGTGSAKAFVADSVTVFNALTNAEVIMPVGYSGEQPTLGIVETDGVASLVFDMQDAIVVTKNNIRFEIESDNVTISSYSAVVDNGKLKVSID